MMIILKIIIIIFGFYHQIASEYQYKIRFAGINCNHDPQYIANVTCYIKAVRGKEGLVNLRWNFTNMPDKDVLLQFSVKYRNSKGNLLPYLINADFDVCKIASGERKETGGGMLLLFKFIAAVAKCPFIEEGCPLKRGVEIINLDFNEVMTKFFPPVIPEGTFLLYWRVYFGKLNHTIMETKQTAKVINTGITRLTMLNMG